MNYRAALLLPVIVVSAMGIVRGTPVAADPPTNAVAVTTAPALVLTPEKGLTVAKTGEATWDFGTRVRHVDEILTHTFSLHNSGKLPLRIETPQTSCRCTEAALALPSSKSHAGAVEDSYTLLPGKSVGLRVDLDANQAHAADFRKMVWVYVRGKDEAAITLTVTGTLSEP